MKIFLARHGSSEGNENPKIYFEKHDSEIELTPKGRTDAINAGLKIISIMNRLDENMEYPSNNPYYFNLVHSTYKRATQTADIITHGIMDHKKFSVQKTFATPLCIEREWGGLRDIIESRRKTEEHFNFYYTPKDGESFCDVYKRVAIFHQWLLNTSKYENNIVVAHGEFNKVYLMHLLNWDVAEFEKWKNQKNGEVWLVEDGKLSSLTPLTPSRYKK
jgi:broad specificity phosphatase PhoE